MRTLSRLLPVLVLYMTAEAFPSLGDALGPRATTFTNPVLWEDYPDLDVFRVGSTFYYSSSTFAYSPGAPVLKSYDLVNWTPVTHSVPTLDFGSQYDLPKGTPGGYVKGIWASTLRYRASNDKFYWYGCIASGQTYIWTSTSNTSAARHAGDVPSSTWSWESHPPIPACYYDAGLLIDDDDADDTMYIAHGNPTISIAQLSPDGLREVRKQAVYTPPSGTTLEGARLYKARGTYYILVTRPADAEYVLKSTSGSVWGPYASRVLVSRVGGPLASAGFAHQGGMGKWYYVAFMDAYPGGRIPVVAPLRWTADGWPEVVTDAQGRWGAGYEVPVQTGGKVVDAVGGWDLDEFRGNGLSHHWEWNHNPEGGKWALLGGQEGGLVLKTASVTGDLFAARNTLTRRTAGPKSRGTFRLDVSKMKDGDRAGAVLFRDRAAYIGVWKQGAEAKIVFVNGLSLTEGTWTTASTGTVAATGPSVSNAQDVWLRVEADITPAFGTSTERTTTFSYSIDGGKTFVRLGQPFAMTNSWRYFSGYRFGVFNFATKELGGEVKVKSFQMQPV
ncbi:hypothetical protein NEMBOFW57_000133 [Staphylotrichum longicolle]|uniref:Beta-xylosidase C-terminal Concanavalin A-like domain-containing protein n=1 Tax=Staphylotrichum longicolle TaxID=669026 RepID=A0AAD4EZ73_9PEZI|nr:hypothetical protein NEMBOFW57_000133 [Staphylotrichum longicolle]